MQYVWRRRRLGLDGGGRGAGRLVSSVGLLERTVVLHVAGVAHPIAVRTWHVGTAVKCNPASVSCHTNRGREIGTDHAVKPKPEFSRTRRLHALGLSVLAPTCSLHRGNNPMRCGGHPKCEQKWTTQHRELDQWSFGSLAPALTSSLAPPWRHLAALRLLEWMRALDAGARQSGERVLLALTNRHIGSARACRTITTSHLLGSGVGVAHARSALRAKRALAGCDLRWKIHQ